MHLILGGPVKSRNRERHSHLWKRQISNMIFAKNKRC